jgi:autotransporter-associated beta strand protein
MNTNQHQAQSPFGAKKLVKFGTTSMVALATAFMAVSVNAQVTFLTPTTVSSTAALDAPLVYSGATLVQAVGFGLPSAQTVNTVSNQTVVFAVGAHSGSAPSGTSTELFYTGTQSGSTLYTGDTGSPAFNTVLQSDGWASGNAPTLPQTLQIGGLTIGTNYVVELLASDTRAGSASRTEQYQDAATGGDASASFSTANATYVLATFTATNTAQTIYVWQTTTGAAGWDTTISAFTLYALLGPITVGNISFSPSSTAHEGDYVILSTAVSGSAIGYQWYWDNGTGGASFSAIAGANGTNYTQNTTGLLGSYKYYFVATNVSSSVTGAVATLTVLAPTAPNTAYWKGGLGNNWSTVSGGVANWTSDAGGSANTDVPPGTPTAVTFAATGAANFNTVLGADFTINNLILSTANNVTIGGITNSLGIVVGIENAGTALNNVINVSNVDLLASQTWENDSANPLTVSSLVGGLSGLTTAGTGTIILSGTNNNYSGGTTISAGTLQLGDGLANDGSVAGDITDNSVLVFANPTAQTFSGVISGAGALGKTGGGVLTLSGANSYNGGTTISNGTLQLNNSSAAGATAEFTTTGTIINNGILNLNIGNNWLFYPISGNGIINVTETTSAESRFDGNMSGFTGVITVPTSAGTTQKTDIEGGAVNWNSAATIIITNGGTLFVESAGQTTGAWAGQAEQLAATIYVSGNGNSEGFGALRVDDGAIITGNVILQGNTVYGGTYTSPNGVSGVSGVIDDQGNGYGIFCANNNNGGQAEEFWGANTYHGTTVWTNGLYTLVLGNGSALQNSTLNIGPGQLQFDSVVSSNAFLFGGLTGTANIGLVNNGGSPINLSVGNNNSSTTYSGNLTDSGTGGSLTKIGAGTLTLGGANSYNGTTTVSGGKLVMNTLQTNVTAGIAANDGTALTLIVSGTNQLAPSVYTLCNSVGPVTNEFAGLTSTAFAPVNAASLTLNGQTFVNIIGGTFAVGNTYPLIKFGSIGGTGGFVLSSLPHGLTANIVTNGGNTIALNVTAYAPVVDVWTGSVNTNWNIGGTANWLISGLSSTYADGDITRFDDTAISTNVFVTTVVSPNSTTISNNTTTYTFTGSAISGVGGLMKQGAGLLVLNQTNTYNGNTVISNGAVRIGGFNAIPGGIGKGDVILNGTLDLNANNDTINGLSGNGTVDTVSGGTPTLTIGSSGSSSTFNGIIQNTAGTLTLTKNGSGTITLGGNNSYSGATTVGAGTLKLANANALGTTAGGTTVATNATLDLNGQSVGENVTLASGATLINSSAAAVSLSGIINAAAGTASMIGGSGNITLQELWNSAQNGQFDVTNVNTGTLDLAGIPDNAYLNIHAVNGTVLLDKQSFGTNNAASALFVEGGTAKLAGSGGDQLFDGNTLTVNSGTFDMNGLTETVGSLVGNGGVVLNSLANTTGTLTIGGVNAAGGDFFGNIQDGAGKIALTKTGTGIAQTLQGVNSYSGNTLINGGTLYLVGGSAISNSVLINIVNNPATNIVSTLDVTYRNDGTLTLNSGQTLTGNGLVNGSVTSLAGSTINPGGGIAVSTLAVSGSVTLGGQLLMDLNRTNTPVNCDQLAAAITYGGTLSVTNLGQALQVGDTFQLFSAAASGFAAINLPTTDASRTIYTWTNNIGVNGSISVLTATLASPSAGFSGTPTNGFAPLQVIFTDASTGGITNWVWNFGNGHAITNTSNSSVTNTYAAPGSYTVALTVNGPGGASTSTKTGYVVASSKPVINSAKLSGGNFILSGANGPAGVQYRILTSTNVALALTNWTPVWTNAFAADGSYNYTNSPVTDKARFFLLVSP